MACREFSLWYNRANGRVEGSRLWLVGNSRYGTITGFAIGNQPVLWLVGNSRYGTIPQKTIEMSPSYGL